MADTELHIHIPGPFDVGKLDSLMNAAMSLLDHEVKQVVPIGYKCIECYADDGSHETTCSIYRAHKAAG